MTEICPLCGAKFSTPGLCSRHVESCLKLDDKGRKAAGRWREHYRSLVSQTRAEPNEGYDWLLDNARQALAYLKRRYERDEATDEQLDEAKKRVDRLEKLHKNGGSK